MARRMTLAQMRESVAGLRQKCAAAMGADRWHEVATLARAIEVMQGEIATAERAPTPPAGRRVTVKG